MLPIPEYWQAVAHGIDAEDRKASLFIKHSASVGTAREAILREVLVKQTPEPFRVGTGFVYQPTPEPWSSKQCDLLVYDPTVAQPYYSIGGIVVLHRDATRLAIEVKTEMNRSAFDDALKLVESVWWLPVPTLCFAYDGVTFETFKDYLVSAIRESPVGVPDCIGVHRQNYIFVRSGYHLARRPDAPGRHRPAEFHLLVNFGVNAKDDGRASASFLGFYDSFVRRQPLFQLPHWFNGLGLADEALIRFTDDGEVQHGPIPLSKT
jgi:hypothetical protein